MYDDVPPTSRGLLRCLQALAEETATLGLPRTTIALNAAIDACRREAGLSLASVAVLPPAELIH